jgi:hypothetical protein
MISAVIKKEAPPAADRPASGAISVKGKMKAAGKLKSELGTLSMFSSVEEHDGGVRAMIVESMDRQKNPHLFIRFHFRGKGADVEYSITPEVPNPGMRKLQVMKTLFTVLSLLESRGAFMPDREDLYSKTLEAFDISTSFTDMEPLKMKYDLGRYTEENMKMRTELGKLKEEKEALNHELMELGRKAEAIEERMKRLESMTNTELDREIVRWVEDHSGKLNEEKFCNSFGIAAQRLEERLDTLSKSGVIRIV